MRDAFSFIAELLTSQGLLAAATLAGLAFGIWGVVVSYRNRARRLLKYRFPIRKQLFFNQFAGTPGFDVRLNGKPVRDLFYLQVVFTHAGNVTIHKADLLAPLQLRFDREVSVFPVSLKRARADIPVSATIASGNGQSTVVFDTELIEPDDQIVYELVYESDGTPSYSIEGRIVDGTIQAMTTDPDRVQDNIHYRIYRHYKANRKFTAMVGTGLLFTLGLRLLQLVFPGFDPKTVSPAILILAFVVSFAVVVWIAYGYFDRQEALEHDRYHEQLAARRALLDAEPATGSARLSPPEQPN